MVLVELVEDHHRASWIFAPLIAVTAQHDERIILNVEYLLPGLLSFILGERMEYLWLTSWVNHLHIEGREVPMYDALGMLAIHHDAICNGYTCDGLRNYEISICACVTDNWKAFLLFCFSDHIIEQVDLIDVR